MGVILHIVDSYPPRADVVARQTAQLATRQAARGDVVHVISRFTGAWARTEAGVRVHRLPAGFRTPSRAHFSRAIELVRPDVVHLHRGRLARAAKATAPGRTVSTSWGQDIPLGLDLAPWLAAGKRRRAASGKPRVLFYAGDLTDQFRGFDPATVIGPASAQVEGADLVLGAAPQEVLPALASEHDVYVSAATLDPYAAGALAAGLTVIPEGLVTDPSRHSWESVLAEVDRRYASAR